MDVKAKRLFTLSWEPVIRHFCLKEEESLRIKKRGKKKEDCQSKEVI